jgi:hypothetical protein
MCILGDPFLTTIYDITALPPVISSSTHPNPSQWYSNGLPAFTWTTPADLNGISGYYYILDQSPSTIPTKGTGTYTTSNAFTPASALAEGTWYLHIVSNDTLGNVGTTAAHYQVNIDATDPAVTISSHVNGAIVGRNITLTWTITETGSGGNYTEVYVDGVLNQTLAFATQQLAFTGLPVGNRVLNVTAYDNSGRAGSNQILVNVVSVTLPPGIPGFPIEAIALGAILAVGLGIVARRKSQRAT